MKPISYYRKRKDHEQFCQSFHVYTQESLRISSTRICALSRVHPHKRGGNHIPTGLSCSRNNIMHICRTENHVKNVGICIKVVYNVSIHIHLLIHSFFTIPLIFFFFCFLCLSITLLS